MTAVAMKMTAMNINHGAGNAEASRCRTETLGTVTMHFEYGSNTPQVR